MKLHDLGEFGLIERLQFGLAVRGGVRVGIGDDAAILDALQMPIVTTDALVENVHFRRDWTPPRSLGRKAMAVNVSDLAATGARPVAAFVTLALSTPLLKSGEALAWIDELYAGFEDTANEYNFTLAGGDTTRASQEVSISVTLVGEAIGADTESAHNSTPLLRSGARPGDVLIVTGTLGDSAAGLWLLQHPEISIDDAARQYLLGRHFEPRARLAEIRAALHVGVGENFPIISAALDLSDGLAGDMLHIARRSNVSLEIEAENLPISEYSHRVARLPDAKDSGNAALEWALHGGEDYELLLCVAPQYAEAVCAAITTDTSTRATIIGRTLPQDEKNLMVLIDEMGGRETIIGGWQHF